MSVPIQTNERDQGMYHTTALRWLVIGVFLGAIVAANLIIAEFGAAAVLYVAFGLVGVNLLARDVLHTAWEGRGLWWRMGALIAAGGVLAYLLNADAGIVAIASVLAFTAAGIVNTVVFHLLKGRRWEERVHGSNLVAAVVDSFTFIYIAIGPIFELAFAQSTAKVAGVVVWLYLARLARGALRGVLARNA